MKIKVSIQKVTKSFGNQTVLNSINLDIYEGETLVILGRSGAGKSVLLKHIIGLIKPEEGTVLVDNTPIWELSDTELTRLRRKFGVSFQEGALFDSLTVFENVAFPLQRLTEMTPTTIRDRVFECLTMVHMEKNAHKYPSELSGGMRRRVGFARSIAHYPEILLFDEPTSGLDPIMSTIMTRLIVKLKENLHATTVVITHNLKTAFEIADRIALLAKGKIIVMEKAEFKKSNDPRIKQFLSGVPEGPLTEGE